jgi:hypothetical protein
MILFFRMRSLEQVFVLLLVLFLSTPVLLDDYDEDSEPEYDTKADYVSFSQFACSATIHTCNAV